MRDPRQAPTAAAAAAARREVRVVQPPYFDDPFEVADPDPQEEPSFVMPTANTRGLAAEGRAVASPRSAAPVEPAAVPRRTVDTSRATVRHGRSDWNGSYKMSQREAREAAASGRSDPSFGAAADDEGRFDDERFDDERFDDGRDQNEAGYGNGPMDDATDYRDDEDADRRADAFEAEEGDDNPYEFGARPDLGDEDAPTLEERIALEAAAHEPDEHLGSPGERLAASGGEEETGGWRGFIANNIVAFPGLKRKAEPEIVRAPAQVAPPAAPSMRAPVQPAMRPVAPARHEPASPPARVVIPSRNDAQSGQSSRARLAELGHPEMNARFELPPIDLLSPPRPRNRDNSLSPEILEQNARLLEGVLEDFGVKGEIIDVRPGPVVTLYELEPAPGIKSSPRHRPRRRHRPLDERDRRPRRRRPRPQRHRHRTAERASARPSICASCSASQDFETTKAKLPLALGKTIDGEPVIADLAKMPHLLVAGTTGSGKSVAINTMILSLLYRLTPEECRLIMIDPKMLELSVYDGIPHLLTPVVTDPQEGRRRAQMDRARDGGPLPQDVEDRRAQHRRLQRARRAGRRRRASRSRRTVQTGFDRETGEAIYETEELDLEPMPYIVVIIDEMADLMMVAGKDIEGAVQRLAQMARAAGIHVIMATQRPSVDVITGTIKANFPTRISFQVTSKIDSRTILGEQGAEQLLGMGDMLYMAGGGRIQRVHGPFVTDDEVEKVVAHLKLPGRAGISRRDHRGRRGRGRRQPAGKGGGERGRRHVRRVRRSLRPGRRRRAARRQGLDLLHPAPPRHRLQPRRLDHRADGEGRHRRPGQPRRQARDPGADRRRQSWAG